MVAHVLMVYHDPDLRSTTKIKVTLLLTLFLSTKISAGIFGLHISLYI